MTIVYILGKLIIRITIVKMINYSWSVHNLGQGLESKRLRVYYQVWEHNPNLRPRGRPSRFDRHRHRKAIGYHEYLPMKVT
jgi:hypothetical protein